MKIILNKKSLALITVLFALVLFLSDCAEEQKNPTEPIFSGVEPIQINQPNSNPNGVRPIV